MHRLTFQFSPSYASQAPRQQLAPNLPVPIQTTATPLQPTIVKATWKTFGRRTDANKWADTDLQGVVAAILEARGLRRLAAKGKIRRTRRA